MRASIVVNNHNYGSFLAAAIDSALGQDWPSVEVVVVDDGSTDESRSIIRSYGDRIVAVCKENGGQASALNAGYERSSGEIVLFLDADDWFETNKVSAVMAAFAADESAGWCFHPLAYDGGEGPAFEGPTGHVDARAAIREGRRHGVVAPATSGLAFRRSLLSRILPMPEDFRVPLANGARGTAADAFVKAAALALAPGVVLDERLAVQRLHGANAYTGRRWADPRRAALELRIAVELRDRWPELRRHSLERGLGGLKRLHAIGASTTVAADAFLAGCTTIERARVRAHQLSWRAVGANDDDARG